MVRDKNPKTAEMSQVTASPLHTSEIWRRLLEFAGSIANVRKEKRWGRVSILASWQDVGKTCPGLVSLVEL